MPGSLRVPAAANEPPLAKAEVRGFFLGPAAACHGRSRRQRTRDWAERPGRIPRQNTQAEAAERPGRTPCCGLVVGLGTFAGVTYRPHASGELGAAGSTN